MCALIRVWKFDKTLQWRHNWCDSVSNHQPHDCSLNRLFRRRSKKTSKLRVTGLCAGNSSGTGEFPAQMASYAENISIWWRHHDIYRYTWLMTLSETETGPAQWPTFASWILISSTNLFNTLGPRQNGHRFTDDIFKGIFLNENVWISIKISLKFVPKGPINNIPALVQIMAWRRPGDKPLSEPTMVNPPTHKCVSQPQWVKSLAPERCGSKFKVLFSNSLYKMVA